jgi:CHAD domain-containing protein
MSYRLKTDEGIADGIRRVMREQLEGGICEMSRATEGTESKAVHATRKRIKKARALLRLVRGQIGRKIAEMENRFLREAGRTFASSRDARVRREMLERLREQIGQRSAAFPQTVVAVCAEIEKTMEDFARQREAALARLQEVCDRIEGWPLENLEMADLCCALTEAYRRGRKCFHSADAGGTAQNFHAVRKRVKDIWYQSRILRSLNPPVLCALKESADTLGRQLGDLHDLTAFRSWLEQETSLPGGERVVLFDLVCTREKELKEIALDLGARFFAEKPKALERRLLRDARTWPARRVCA